MNATLRGMTVEVDGVTYTATVAVDQQVEDVREAVGGRPDPGWAHVDRAGHYHTWADNGTLPTLLPPDDLGDDEHCWPHYTCRICGEPVKPGWAQPGTWGVTQRVVVAAYTLVTVEDAILATPHGGTATVVVRDPDGQAVLFGVGLVTDDHTVVLERLHQPLAALRARQQQARAADVARPG